MTRIDGRLLRVSAVTAGVFMLTSVAGVAIAQVSHGESGVSVNVEIPEIEEPGVLALSVAGTTSALTENGSDALVRQFTGTLPSVTVTDTRSADDIPDGAFWYVLGTSTDFTGDDGQEAISAGHLGWAPRLIDGGESGLVAEGDEVGTVLDAEAGPGLVDQELLALAADSAAVAEEGQWTANADLFLRTPTTVAAGNYAATLTLSLFE
ncbi:hypothetical protein [Parafrankia elaeagni]|uniref:hypothetical protein n=1 Tax=Parafrankia elaeagni TaxID=222534 RepID=UPI000360E170|nr:hypothetical protein [Parafrankia elaeagni]